MTTKPRIAIALATWNGERFLQEQLESYLAQTRLPDQLVVSDDHSRDRSVDIVRQFGKEAPFEVRILANSERVGYARNFGRAILACQADIILLSDQDDIWLPRHVEKLVQPFVEGPEGRKEEVVLVLSRSRHFCVDIDGSRREWEITTSALRRWNWDECLRIGLIAGFVKHREPPFAGHGIAFKASLREWLFPLPPDFHDFWIDCVGSALGGFVFVNEVLTLHRVHDRNTAGFGHAKPFTKLVRRSPERFQKELDRWRTFVERMESCPTLSDRGRRSIALARRAVRCLESRSWAQSLGWMGVGVCLAALLRGDYHRAALGSFTFARDVIHLLRGPILRQPRPPSDTRNGA